MRFAKSKCQQMPAVLRISGSYQELEKSLSNQPFAFAEAIASRKKRERGETPLDGASTFNFCVSEASGTEVPVQIDESVHFLLQHFESIRRLRQSPGVETLTLDFSWDFPSTRWGQFNRFSNSLLQLCAELEIDIVVSVYGSM
jgi:hypothetical protein